ncbi:MAG: InlB B-repeat-containing protein, partial [Coprobacillaceae bacterium]
YKIKLVKVDANNNSLKLPNAQFKISGTNHGKTQEVTVTTDSNGEVTTPISLIPGTYTVTELVAPTGYQQLTSTITLTVNKGGTSANVDFVIENTPITQTTYTVLYDGNNSTGGIAPVDTNNPYALNALVTVMDKGTLQRTNYTFTGWNTRADGLGTSYNATDTFNITENVTLYAQWSLNAINPEYTVLYDGNGSTGGLVPIDTNNPYTPNASVTVLDKGTLERTDYTFTGWNTSADGSGTPYAPTDTFNITENVTLYAQWTSNTIPSEYTVLYDGNGNTGGTIPSDTNSPYMSGTTVTVLDKETLEKTNYTFVGWNTEADGSGTWYQAGDTFVITADITLYAQWKSETPKPPIITPEEPENRPSKPSNSIRTGDTTNIEWYILSALICSSVVFIVKRKKEA